MPEINPDTGLPQDSAGIKPYLQMGNAYQTTGVQRTLYQNVDFNMMNWPQSLLYQALQSGSIAPTLPNPIVGLKLQLPDGDTTVPALGWQSANAVGSGLYRVGVQDFGWVVNSSLVTEWLASEFRINYLTPGSVLFAAANGKVQQNNASFFWDDTIHTLKLPGTQLGTFAANSSGPYAAGTDNARIGEGRALGNPIGNITTVASAGGQTGTFKYAYIEWDVSGNHTGLSPQTTVVAVAQQYAVTVPQQRSGVIARSLCRTKAGGSTFYLLHNFASGDHVHQTIWQDNTADAALVTAVTDADSTMMYKFVANTGSAYGGSFMCTHPDQQGSNAIDLTLLTNNPTDGSLGMDCYGGISARAVTSPALQTRITGVNASAFQYVAYWLDTTDNAAAANVVYSIGPQGQHTLSPNTSALTDPSWFDLRGGIAGNYMTVRVSTALPRAGFYVGTASEPYLGSGITYTGGDTYSYASLPVWRLGNASGSTTIPFKVDVAGTGTVATAISWTNAIAIDTTGKIGFNQIIPRRRLDVLDAGGSAQIRATYTDNAVFVDLKCDSAGQMIMLPTGSNLSVQSTTANTAIIGVSTVGANTSTVSIRAITSNLRNGECQFHASDATPHGWLFVATTGGAVPVTFRGTAPSNSLVVNTSGQVQMAGNSANGQNISIESVSELTTIAAAATTATAIQIPLNAVVFAVSVRVTVIIPTAATFTVTGTTSTTQFDVAGGVAVAAGTTDVGTANCTYKNGAAQTITITPNLVPAANTGRVRVTIHYYKCTPATS